MSIVLRCILITGAVLMMLFMLKRIRQSKLKIEYVIFWIGFSGILIIMGIFPKFFYVVSHILGFQSPINMIYLVIIFILIIKLFFTTIQISQLENKIDSLAQRIAIERKNDKDKLIKDKNEYGEQKDKN